MEKLGPAALTLSLVVVAFVLIWWGWRNRLKRQQDLAPLPELPGKMGQPTLEVEGQYVVTTSAGDWLDRIAVHGLGIRTNARLGVHPQGVLLTRSGAPDLYIDAGSLTGVRTEAGMAGKFVEKDGLVVLTWLLGETPVDTGFRTRRAADRSPLLAALNHFLPPAPAPSPKDRP